MKTIAKISTALLFLFIVTATTVLAQWTSTPPDLYTTDNVGIGGVTAPNYLLQTHEGTASTANYIQVSNNTSGSASGDGLLVGLDASGNALLNQQENLPMIFSTNATEQMRLLANGNLGIGIATPGHLLELVTGGDLNLEDGIIRIGDNNMVYRDADNNVA